MRLLILCLTAAAFGRNNSRALKIEQTTALKRVQFVIVINQRFGYLGSLPAALAQEPRLLVPIRGKAFVAAPGTFMKPR